MDAGPWPCRFQYQASRFAGARKLGPWGTVRGRLSIPRGLTTARGAPDAPPPGAPPPPSAGVAPLPAPPAAGTAPLASGARLVMAVLLETIGTGRNQGATEVR